MRSFFLGVFLLALAGLAVAQEVRVLVVYHSESGNTETMARALAHGARQVPGSQVLLRTYEEVAKEDLAAADAIALGSPVHMGDVAWQVRQAIVRWSMDFGYWESRALQNRPAAVFATGAMPSNGKEFTMMSLGGSLLQLGMVLVSPYGSFGASATTARPDPGVDDAEKKIATDLGERLARIAQQMKRGARQQDAVPLTSGASVSSGSSGGRREATPSAPVH
ncbi:MAG: flavodoxin domain-containing protein [Bryobacterales bacterium]|jgi:NAD(P)H dehydrogenase (quinone)|nr:flavodoxin domain-containing protein [Bryobacterales bacterium]